MVTVFETCLNRSVVFSRTSVLNPAHQNQINLQLPLSGSCEGLLKYDTHFGWLPGFTERLPAKEARLESISP